jgi:hypothetical protein
VRSVDGLLAQGESRRLDDGGIEIERRTIRGVTYSVRAWDNEAQTRRVCVDETEFEVSDLVGRLEGGYVFAIPDREELRELLHRIYKMFQDEQDKACQSWKIL